jgi:hypothetical protein
LQSTQNKRERSFSQSCEGILEKFKKKIQSYFFSLSANSKSQQKENSLEKENRKAYVLEPITNSLHKNKSLP